MDWLKQINQVLAKTRDKSYRKKTDSEIQRSNNAYLLSQSRRVIDPKHYKEIFDEYWRVDQPRMQDFKNVYAKKFNTRPGIIELVVDNRYNIVTAEEYEQIKLQWNETFPNYRSDMLKELNKTGRRKISHGRSHSEKRSRITEQAAREIYNICLSGPNTRTHDFYKTLAKQYNMNWHAVQKIALGDHYSLCKETAAQDIEQWRLTLGEGNYEMIDPTGQSHIFNDLRELGYFIQTQEGKSNTDTTKNWYTARNWFEKCQPNTWYTKERRTFKGWKYCNHLPAKTK